MAIRSKPAAKTALQTKALDKESAFAFVGQAAVNQTVLDKEAAPQFKDEKRRVMLKLWASELAQIDAAVAKAAEGRPQSRNRITRHGWIIQTIFEKIERSKGN